MYKFETEHLALSPPGSVLVKSRSHTDVTLGPLADEPDWPARLGPEPLWYAAELAELIRLREADEREQDRERHRDL
jgi:hypothetical protein